MRAIVMAEHRAERLAREEQTRVVVTRQRRSPPVENIDFVSDSSSEETTEAATETTTRNTTRRQGQLQDSAEQWVIDAGRINSNQDPENFKLAETGEVTRAVGGVPAATTCA